jgi:hypothetical protein
MNKNTIKQTLILSGLALGAALSASAQSASSAAPNLTAADPGPGLLGSNYSELSFGYQRQDAPRDLRDYEFVSNASIYKEASLGLDGNFTYDYIDGGDFGFIDHRNEAQLGLTGFLMQPWGKPFLSADAGMAWQDAANVSRKGLAYSIEGGVEFQVLKDLALSPYIEYQAEPGLYNHGLPAADFPDHLVDFGVKATYRITREWSAVLGADLDQRSGRDWGLSAGISYRY